MRTKGVLVAAAVLAALLAGCSSSSEGSSSTSAARPVATAPPTSAATPVTCNGDDEFNQDDDGAQQGLLRQDQLPAGWTTSPSSPCTWARSADELLAVPECRAAAQGGGAAPDGEARNGNAHVRYEKDGLEIDDRVEIYTSAQNVDAIRTLLASPDMPACFAAAIEARAKADPGTTVSDVEASGFDVHPTADELGLGFPAVDTYDADSGFAKGVSITFTKTADGKDEPVAMKVVTFGAGGLMSTLTLTGRTQADLDAIDLPALVRAAAADHLDMIS